jgi:hypothetical protein
MNKMNKWNNLYRDRKGRPRLRKSVVAFIDLLGYTADVLSAQSKGKDAEYLIRLRKAFDSSLPQLASYLPTRAPKWWLNTFTDNVVLGFPLFMSEDEGILQVVTRGLSVFQLYMTLDGFFMRGGVAIGDVYFDEDIVFGPALIEAYEVESRLARDPRIVLGKSCTKYLSTQIFDNTFDLLKDTDDQVFLNYLNRIIWYDIYDEEVSKSNQKQPDFLTQHKLLVESKLKKYSPQPSVWAKYNWVARYHNFFCRECAELPETYFVDVFKIEFGPQRIKSK